MSCKRAWIKMFEFRNSLAYTIDRIVVALRGWVNLKSKGLKDLGELWRLVLPSPAYFRHSGAERAVGGHAVSPPSNVSEAPLDFWLSKCSFRVQGIELSRH